MYKYRGEDSNTAQGQKDIQGGTVGSSESHIGKIEAGTRQPGILTYQKIMEVLGESMLIKNERKTVKE